MMFISDVPHVNPHAIQKYYEVPHPQTRGEMLDYFITVYPRISDNKILGPQFAYSYFKNNEYSFSPNQDKAILYALSIFEDSTTLGSKEQFILNSALKKSLKNKPSRPNRK